MKRKRDAIESSPRKRLAVTPYFTTRKSFFDDVQWDVQRQKWFGQKMHDDVLYETERYENDYEAGLALSQILKQDKYQGPRISKPSVLKNGQRNDDDYRPSRERRFRNTATAVSITRQRSRSTSAATGSPTSSSEGAKNHKYGYLGVSQQRKTGKWIGQGRVNFKSKILNSYADTEEECARLVRLKVAELRAAGNYVTSDYGSPNSLNPYSRQQSKKRASAYMCVSLLASGRWQARFNYGGKVYRCGTYDSEIEAAHAINEKCDEIGIPHKNPFVSDNTNNAAPVSSYKHVYWRKKSKKWRGKGKSNGKLLRTELYESDRDAAFALNRICKEAGVLEPNPDLNDGKNKIPSSAYLCVHKSPSGTGMWIGKFIHNKKYYGCGSHKSELEAALAVNRKCHEIGIPCKNPGIDESTNISKAEKSSKYRNVTRHTRTGKWQASFRHEGQYIWCGRHEYELDAALAVNKRCDEMGIKRKNPEIIDDSFNEEVFDKEFQHEGEENDDASWSPYKYTYQNASGKWQGKKTCGGKSFCTKLYENEKDAALELNRIVQSAGYEAPNPCLLNFAISLELKEECEYDPDVEFDDKSDSSSIIEFDNWEVEFERLCKQYDKDLVYSEAEDLSKTEEISLPPEASVIETTQETCELKQTNIIDEFRDQPEGDLIAAEADETIPHVKNKDKANKQDDIEPVTEEAHDTIPKDLNGGKNEESMEKIRDSLKEMLKPMMGLEAMMKEWKADAQCLREDLQNFREKFMSP